MAALLEDTRQVILNIFFKLLIALFLITFCSLLTTSVSAQTNSATPSATTHPVPITTTSFRATSPHTTSQAIYNFSHAMSCLLTGQSQIAPCLEYKIYKDATGMVHSVPYLSSVNTNYGLLGISLSMVNGVMTTPAISSSEFIANLGEQLGIKEAHAQVGGSGSGVLAPIFKLWEMSRNIAYLAMIIIFIIVGLMVMFRKKLNPQTVVSIQMALPGLVIGLIMITFSYFLASVISDVAFIGTNLVGQYFAIAQGEGLTPTQLPLIDDTRALGGVTGKEQEANVLTIFSRYTNILGVWSLTGMIHSIWPFLEDPNRVPLHIIMPGAGLINSRIPIGMDPALALSAMAEFVAVQFVLPFGGLWGGKGQAIAALIPTVVSLIPSVNLPWPWEGSTASGTEFMVAFSLSWITMIALIYSMFKLLLKLIQNLLAIIFLTITAPFYFLAASIPGRQGLMTTWLFNMLCNVLAFPAVFAVFYFVAFLLNGNTGIFTKDPLFAIGDTTSIAGNTTFPLLGGFNSAMLNRLLAFGALLALPSVPDIICRTVGKPSQLGGLAAGALGGALASGQRYQGQMTSGLSGFAGNMGRLTTDEGLIHDPTILSPENIKETYGAHGYTARDIGKTVGYRRPITPQEFGQVGRAGQFAKWPGWLQRPFRAAGSVLPSSGRRSARELSLAEMEARHREDTEHHDEEEDPDEAARRARGGRGRA